MPTQLARQRHAGFKGIEQPAIRQIKRDATMHAKDFRSACCASARRTSGPGDAGVGSPSGQIDDPHAVAVPRTSAASVPPHAISTSSG